MDRIPTPAPRCEAEAVRGTGTGACEQPLDPHGNCPAANRHL